jgi:hypothetical protein
VRRNRRLAVDAGVVHSEVSLTDVVFHSEDHLERVHTKEPAEALLRQLPSVLGAFVREDINGHPREIHLLVSPGPNVKLLAQDVRELLEEKLAVPIDHRIISIAQLAEDIADDDAEATLTSITEPSGERRVRLLDVRAEVRDQRVRVITRLQSGETVFQGESNEIDLGVGRLRAAATATLRAAADASIDDVRLELEAVAVIKAFDREYVLVSVLAGSNALGRRLLQLAGAQPIEHDTETAAALATLKSINRVLAKVLD